jgi:hypothetical protein
MPSQDSKKLMGVEAIYRLLDAMNTELESNVFCNSVSMGFKTEVDLAKQTIFPMAHIYLDTINFNDNSMSFNLTIINLDIVTISKDLPENSVYYKKDKNIFGNDNLVYIWTNQLYVINQLISRLKQSTTFSGGWQLDGTPTSTFINKELENMLAGFETTLSITVPNDISKC